MARKTVSLDVDIYLRIKSLQKRNESISGALRRVLEEERDPADYLDELFRDYGGKGMLTQESRRMLRYRQEHPVRSKRPGRLQNAPRAL